MIPFYFRENSAGNMPSILAGRKNNLEKKSMFFLISFQNTRGDKIKKVEK
jgi:hypothetical protein